MVSKKSINMSLIWEQELSVTFCVWKSVQKYILFLSPGCHAGDDPIPGYISHRSDHAWYSTAWPSGGESAVHPPQLSRVKENLIKNYLWCYYWPSIPRLLMYSLPRFIWPSFELFHKNYNQNISWVKSCGESRLKSLSVLHREDWLILKSGAE